MKFETPKPAKDGWTEWVQPIRRGYKMVCCDCALVHNMDFRIHRGRVQFRVARNSRSTALARRHSRIRVRHTYKPLLTPSIKENSGGKR